MLIVNGFWLRGRDSSQVAASGWRAARCPGGAAEQPTSARERRSWLGGRDSNPDTVVQSHVSYRWTTSQCQSRRLLRRELLIIANPKPDRQASRLAPVVVLIVSSTA